MDEAVANEPGDDASANNNNNDTTNNNANNNTSNSNTSSAASEELKNSAATAIAAAFETASCFPPPATVHSPTADNQQQQQQVVAAPPDWSVIDKQAGGGYHPEVMSSPVYTANNASYGNNRSYDNSPRGSIATSYSGGSAGHSHTTGGMPPVPPLYLNVNQGLSSRSGDTLASNNPNTNPAAGTANAATGTANMGGGLGNSFNSGGASQQQQQGGANADASVLLGLEELERQQADLEKRRAFEAEKLRKQQENAYTAGLPPLAPVLSGESTHHVRNMHHSAHGGNTAEQHHNEQHPHAVPSQIHLDEEEITLTSEVTDRGMHGGDMKKVNSIEKLGKLRGQMSVSFRRFRSWSMSGASENPVDSVDSTQKETLSRSSNAGVPNNAGGGATSSSVQQQQQPSAAKTTIQEPYLEDGELKPIIYGYLHKLGRNGHWQKRFFETNGRSLTYYKNEKRTKVLATLDLCKVGEITIDQTDPDKSTFTIQVSNRPYYLRAEDKTQCNDWVINLNRQREARMEMGNIQLVTSPLDDPHRSQAGPHIVISALRPRTHGSDLPPDLLTCHTDEAQEQIEVMGNWDHLQEGGRVQSVTSGSLGGKLLSPRKSSVSMTNDATTSMPTMAKWQKKHSAMHQLSLRFLNWARSITKQADACRRESDVVVVPAHVLASLSSSSQQIETSIPPPTGTSSARRKVSGSGSDLPVLAEEGSAPAEGRADGQNRSRTSTNSSAGGIVGSQYV